MADNFGTRATATTFDVEYLVGMAWNGQIRVPHFQRDFRWTFEDVRRLFDSIVKGYPIGSLLLWRRSAEEQTLSLGDLRIEAPAMKDAYWVVDGQQRLTSIANALHPASGHEFRFALSYDLRSDEFVKSPAIPNPFVVPLGTMFDLQKLLKWFSINPTLTDYLDSATNVTRRIRQYEVPAYLVDQDDPAVLRDIFDRMNNYGKRLSRAEIFSALNAGPEDSQESSPNFDEIARSIDADTDFGIIDDNTILACVLATRGPDVRRDIRKEFHAETEEQRAAAYAAGVKATLEAVRFLQNDAHVPHVSLLAYRYLLVVLTRFFALYPSATPRSRRLLRRWYWRAALAGPEQFKGGTPNAARVLCGKLEKGDESDSVARLLESNSNSSSHHYPDFLRFSTAEASTKVLLCAFWAMGPRSVRSGEVLSKSDLALTLGDSSTARPAVRELLPRSEVPIDFRNWPANRLLIPEEEDAADIALSLTSSTLAPDSFSAVLDSHQIPWRALDFLDYGEVSQFIKARQSLITENAKRFIDEVCEWNFEDTPSLDALFLEDEEV